MADRVVSYEFKGSFQNLQAGLASAGKSVGDLGTKLTALDKNGAQMRAGLDTLGGAAAKVGLVAAAGLGAAVVAGANFDQAMSKVQAATGETAAGMEELRAAALKAGADTAFSASEAAAGIEALSKAGVSTADILGGGLTGALDLAAAGELAVGEAAEIAATTMTQFGLAGTDVAGIADVLAASAGKAQGSVTDMAGALQYVGPVAAQMGLSLEETGGSIAYLATQGIVGQQAGTSLRGMLTSLTSPSKIAKEQMEALGISMYDASGAFIGLDGLAGQLQVGMENLTEAERNEALGRIFGNEQITAARILYAGGADAITEWTAKVDDSGYAAEQAATKLDNLRGDLEALSGSLETALIGTGDGAQGPLRSLVQNTTEVVNAFNDLPPAAKNVTASLLGITAVTGGGLWLGSKVINSIASTKVALGQLGVTAGTTSKALASVGKGVTFAAILAGLWAVDEAFDALEDREFDTDNLARGLEALSEGRVVDNLGKIGSHVRNINAEGLKLTDTLFGWAPGETRVAEAATELEKVDTALAGMVESGNADMAADAFAQIERQATELGVSTEDVAKTFGQYRIALDNLKGGHDNWIDRALEAARAQGNLGMAIDQASNAGDRQAKKMEAQAAALKDSRSAARETARAFVGLGSSLDDADVSLGDWLKQLESQADALRNFRKNAEEAADKGLRRGLIDALHEAGPAGALRMRQLAKATDEQIDRANAAWKRGQEEVKRYTDAIGGVPKRVNTDVTVNTGDALRGINNLEARLNAISDEDVWINIRHRSDGRDTGMGPQVGAAAGGHVRTLAPTTIPTQLQGSAA